MGEGGATVTRGGKRARSTREVASEGRRGPYTWPSARATGAKGRAGRDHARIVRGRERQLSRRVRKRKAFRLSTTEASAT